MTENNKAIKEATDILVRMKSNPTAYFNEGSRNNDCVNWSIACHVIGLDPIDEFYVESGELFSHAVNDSYVREKFDTISGYLDEWGPKGQEEEALEYIM